MSTHNPHEAARPSRRALLGLAGGLGAAGLIARTQPESRERPTAPGNVPHSAFLAPGSRHSDQIPNVTLFTQSGRAVRLYDDLIRDSQVLLSFMYVQCNGICPASSQAMQDLREPLCRELGTGVRLISLTLDPEQDRPADLARYAGRFGISHEDHPQPGLAPWYFLTGTPDDIEAVRVALGYRDPDPVIDADRSRHAAMFTFGNDLTNRWGTLPVGLNTAQTLSGVLRMLGTTHAQRYSHLPRPS
ncbi:MAG TPA: SCO family protein [Planctomycetaceae bacterium]|jgi:protein SCO1/2|nr:SCO family protein [Planctomycetaceae bacterium]